VHGDARTVKVPTGGGYNASKTVRPPVPPAPAEAGTEECRGFARLGAQWGEGDLFNVAVIARSRISGLYSSGFDPEGCGRLVSPFPGGQGKLEGDIL